MLKKKNFMRPLSYFAIVVAKLIYIIKLSFSMVAAAAVLLHVIPGLNVQVVKVSLVRRISALVTNSVPFLKESLNIQ